MRRVFGFCAFALLALGCDVPVQYGLDESAANEVVTALERANIAAAKVREEGGGNEPAFMVTVTNREDVRRAIELMRNIGLPRTRRSGLAEMYGQPSLVPSATEERARFLKALGNDIERTLETIDGVVSARVHIVLPEADPLAADAKPRVAAQAGVLIKTRAGVTIPLKESDVQRLVAGAVSGLQTANVAVVVTAAPDWASTGQPSLIAVGPIRMTPGSRAVLFGALRIVLGVVAVLALVLLLMARRLAAAQRALSTRRA
jgi:type III secretion protein J